jgi:4-amino-4-deoxy-L-arabinose transferase-like glycosyltransferase
LFVIESRNAWDRPRVPIIVAADIYYMSRLRTAGTGVPLPGKAHHFSNQHRGIFPRNVAFAPGARIRIILAVALIARLLILWFAIAQFGHSWLFTRGIELGTLAQCLLTGHGLSSPFGGSTGPTALLAPGYPVIIACTFRLFGSFTFAAAIAVMALQLLFNVVTVFMIMHVAQQCFDVRAVNLAGAFWALSLPVLWMPTIFWDTCLSTLLLVSMIAWALRYERRPGLLLWAFMGAYCGLALLVNPALVLALLSILGWAAWQTRKTFRYSPLLGLLILLLVYAPWPMRNARVLHAFIPMRSTIGFELWVGNRAGASGFLDESQFPLFNQHEFDSYVAKGEVAYMQDKSTLAKAYIRSHPLQFLQMSMVRFLRFWMGTGTKDGSMVFAIHAVLTTSLGLLGLWRLANERRFKLAVLFLLPLTLLPLPYYITHAEFRYRLLIDPILVILAGYALSSWFLAQARARSRPA